MPSCIICHMNINEEEDPKQCPNGHLVHKDCLIEWLTHSKTCPLCSEPYSLEIIQSLQNLLDAREKEKEEARKKEENKEIIAKIERVAEKIAFLSYIEQIEKLIESKEYDQALERLGMLECEQNLLDYKSQKIMFLRGKINFLKERYDLSINCLFKLVKAKFDYPDAFLYLGKSYEHLGLTEKAKWAYERVK